MGYVCIVLACALQMYLIEGVHIMNKKYSIMVVDDDPLIGGMISRYLDEKSGFEVRYFEDPKQALKQVVKQRPDMIILDWAMPKLSGLQFLLRLRKNKKIMDTPVFMLTAKRTGGDFETACTAGVDGYLTKPVDFNQLNNRIVGYFANA